MWIKKGDNFDGSSENLPTIPGKSQIKHELIIGYNSTPLTIIMAEIELKFFYNLKHNYFFLTEQIMRS